MDLNLRIKKYNKGWVVEYQKPKWSIFGIKSIWIHYISVTGIHKEPWYFQSEEMAQKEMLLQLKWNALRNSAI